MRLTGDVVQWRRYRALMLPFGLTIAVGTRWWRPDDGPCYDYCACRWCWRGWTGIPFRTRLRWRISYIRRAHGSK